MNKYFIYQFKRSKYEGYRLLCEKSIFDAFQKIVYNGFKINYRNYELINFTIDSQVIRKLKLQKIEGHLKQGSVEERLSQLLDRSTEQVEEFNKFTASMSHWWLNETDDLSKNINTDFLEKRWRNKYCANKYKNKK